MSEPWHWPTAKIILDDFTFCRSEHHIRNPETTLFLRLLHLACETEKVFYVFWSFHISNECVLTVHKTFQQLPIMHY